MLATCVFVPMLPASDFDYWYDRLLSHSVTHLIKTVEPKSKLTVESLKIMSSPISRNTPGAHNTTNSIRFVYVAFVL